MNNIQRQAILSMPKFQSCYAKNERREAVGFACRRRQGWQCPRCQDKRIACTHNKSRLRERLSYGYQCSPIVETVFDHTKQPLAIWFLTFSFHLMTQGKNPNCALLARPLKPSRSGRPGISTLRRMGYPTAWGVPRRSGNTAGTYKRRDAQCVASHSHHKTACAQRAAVV